MVGDPADWEQRGGDGRGGGAGRSRGGGTKRFGALVVVEKNVVALKVMIQIVFHCGARCSRWRRVRDSRRWRRPWRGKAASRGAGRGAACSGGAGERGRQQRGAPLFHCVHTGFFLLLVCYISILRLHPTILLSLRVHGIPMLGCEPPAEADPTLSGTCQCMLPHGENGLMHPQHSRLLHKAHACFPTRGGPWPRAPSRAQALQPRNKTEPRLSHTLALAHLYLKNCSPLSILYSIDQIGH